MFKVDFFYFSEFLFHVVNLVYDAFPQQHICIKVIVRVPCMHSVTCGIVNELLMVILPRKYDVAPFLA